MSYRDEIIQIFRENLPSSSNELIKEMESETNTEKLADLFCQATNILRLMGKGNIVNKLFSLTLRQIINDLLSINQN